MDFLKVVSEMNTESVKIAAVVVLYHPSNDVLSNIRSYAAEVECLFLIDNSAVQNDWIIEKAQEWNTNARYKYLGGNKGIGVALNCGCELAMAEGCSWILTMDQDSYFNGHDFARMRGGLAYAGFPAGAAIITPRHLVHHHFSVATTGERYQVEKSAMTSGNLLSLAAYKKAGPFREDYFIDYVDHEYCLRLRKNGYIIYCDTSIALQHALGDFQLHSISGKSVGASHHNALRRYYMTRNGFDTAWKYFSVDPLFAFKIIRTRITELIKVMLFERDKRKKVKAFFYGFAHFLCGRFGVFKSFQ
ncbi:glycosyltransferase [Parasegetibacter sp. NRK P23]|uniref:glycosyltransferase n=1 Tax=Parasegetibacter sp. NRK P23 TaxID=2942999 RepID=UPI0020436E39|nr:glycosyltransferase [Parasegetibacter sp. NRK P23]MCM5527513.1 glycosyltransferase [Parasegetibacter sp. NRK P23]